MNKNEFVNKVYEQSGLTKKDCKLCLEAMIDVIRSALKQGDCVTLSKFGKFKVNDNKSKIMYNFKTKTTEYVEARKTPVFKASDTLKQCIK